MLGFRLSRIGLLAVPALALYLPVPAGLSAQNSSALFYSSTLFYDFDGDGAMDRAEVLPAGARHSIELNLSSFGRSRLPFGAPAARGFLVAMDVNRDRDLDLVWITPAEPQSSIIWLGDGHGHFAIVQDSNTYRGELASLSGSGAPQSLSKVGNEKRAVFSLGFAPCLAAERVESRLRSVRVFIHHADVAVPIHFLTSNAVRGPPSFFSVL